MAPRTKVIDRSDPGSWETDGDLGAERAGAGYGAALQQLSSSSQPSGLEHAASQQDIVGPNLEGSADWNCSNWG